jgi:hypothetical protein
MGTLFLYLILSKAKYGLLHSAHRKRKLSLASAGVRVSNPAGNTILSLSLAHIMGTLRVVATLAARFPAC